MYYFAFTMRDDIGCRRNTKDFLIEILKGVAKLFNAVVRQCFNLSLRGAHLWDVGEMFSHQQTCFASQIL